MQEKPPNSETMEKAAFNVLDLEGKTIDGKYLISKVLGRGGSGVVYRAEHTLINRLVAIKILHAHLVENEESLKRFRHEAKIASKLNHPNAVVLYDFGMYERLPYLVFEFVQGVTLKEMILRRGALPLTEVYTIFEQVCSALGEAHRLGIVHRDMKPENIMITPREGGGETVKVLDFGIAKVLRHSDELSSTVVTQTGMFYGTPQYASPEQVLTQSLDARSDIYSLGVILYEALSGETPFSAPSLMEILMKQLHEVPVALHLKNPSLNLSAEVDAVLLKCLAKQPDERFQSVEQLMQDFAVAKSVLPSRSRGSRRTAGIAVSASIIGVLLAGAFFGFHAWLNQSPKEIVAAEKIENPAPQQPEVVVAQIPGEAAPLPAQMADAALALARLVDRKLPTPPDPPIDEMTTPAPLAEAHTPPPAVVAREFNTVESSEQPELPPSEKTELSSVASTVSGMVSQPPFPLPDGQSPEELFREGERLFEAKRYAEAIERLRQSASLRPRDVKTRLVLGICYLRTGNYQSAYEQFTVASQIDNNYAPVHYNLACYYALTKQPERALGALEKSISLNPRSRRWARTEPDLASLRGMDTFKRLVGN